MTGIRRATVADAEGIAQVSVATWRATYRGRMPDAVLDNLSVAERAAFTRDRLSEGDPQRATFVAEDTAGQIVGFAACGPDRTGDPTYTGEIYALYVLPAAQGRGIGRDLVAAAVEHLRGQGHAAMLVWVLDTNPARGFYARLGGVAVGEAEIELGGARLTEIGYGFTFDAMRL